MPSLIRSLSCKGTDSLTSDEEFHPRDVYQSQIVSSKSMELLEDGTYVNEELKGSPLLGPPPGKNSLVQCYEELLQKSSSKLDAFGTKSVSKDGTFGPLVWSTRQQFIDDVLLYSEGLRRQLNLYVPQDTFEDMGIFCPAPEIVKKLDLPEGVETLRILGTSMKNSSKFIVMEYIAQLLGITLVPLYDTLGSDGMAAIIKDTRMTSLVVDLRAFAALIATWEANKESYSHFPKYLIFTDDTGSIEWELYKGAELKQRAEAIGCEVTFLESFKADYPISYENRYNWNMENIWTISYTSGTTGRPKGAMLTQRALLTVIHDVIHTYCSDEGLFNTGKHFPTYFSYLPFAHILERTCINATLLAGLRVGFHSGQVTTLVDEIRESETTILMCVPRVLERIHSKVMDTMNSKGFVVKGLFNKARTAKVVNRRSTSEVKHVLWDSIIMNKVKSQVVGSQLSAIICGGAPLSTMIREDCEAFLGVQVIIGYGLTESSGAIFVQHSSDVQNAIGWLMNSCKARLRDVPDLEKYAANGEGEILLRGHTIFSGYFRQPSVTKEVFTDDGWFISGDVAIIDKTYGGKIVDRAKNCFKLAQGEYIAPEKIENIMKGGFVDQIIILGRSTESSCVAFVTLSEGYINKSGRPAEELVMDEAVRQQLSETMMKNARAANLFGFEIPKYFIFGDRSLLPDDGFHTPTLKVRRPLFQKKFEPLLNQVYESGQHVGVVMKNFL